MPPKTGRDFPGCGPARTPWHPAAVRPVRGRVTAVLRGRGTECERLGGLLDAVRSGQSRALVLRGEAGVGKTALLDDLATRARGFRVVRVAGVQSEMELAFAGLHQLRAPMTNSLTRLHAPQGDALRAAFGLPGARALTGRLQELYQRRILSLPSRTRQLLLVASAEPGGDPGLLWRAADRLAVGIEAVTPAIAAGLVQIDDQVRFRHPLVRSAVYWAASPEERCRAHRALAEATDPRADPDRRAWHAAQGTRGPSEDVAAQLVRSADRARARGGLAAAAAARAACVTAGVTTGRRARPADLLLNGLTVLVADEGLDTSRLAVAGDSVGRNMTAALTILAKWRGDVPPPRCAPPWRTWPGCRTRSSSSTSATCCVTRARPTPAGSSRRASPPPASATTARCTTS